MQKMEMHQFAPSPRDVELNRANDEIRRLNILLRQTRKKCCELEDEVCMMMHSSLCIHHCSGMECFQKQHMQHLGQLKIDALRSQFQTQEIELKLRIESLTEDIESLRETSNEAAAPDVDRRYPVVEDAGEVELRELHPSSPGYFERTTSGFDSTQLEELFKQQLQQNQIQVGQSKPHC